MEQHNRDNFNTILIIDDDFVNRKILAKIFSDMYEIREAANGSAGLSEILTNRQKFCAIFLDVVMPGMNGIEVLRHLKKMKIPEKIPIFLITAEYEDYYVSTVYVPNSQRELTRLGYRMEWEEAFLGYIKNLEKTKPVIYCGDLNVAHQEIDLKNPKTNRRNAGFTDEERNCFTKVLESGFLDTFRHLYPEARDAYSWWSYMGQARARNVGWRIDYFVASESLKEKLADAKIHSQIMGSDHCPVELDLKEASSQDS